VLFSFFLVLMALEKGKASSHPLSPPMNNQVFWQVRQTDNRSLFPYQVGNPFIPDSTITAVGDVRTIHLVEDLIESAQREHPALLITVKSVDIAVSPDWWNRSNSPTTGIFLDPMTEDQIATFRQERRGRRLIQFDIGLAPVVLVSHKSNPIADRGLHVSQIDAMFSSTRYRGHSPIQRWEDAGLGGTWMQVPVIPIGQYVPSSLTRYFKREILKDGDMKFDVVRLPDSASVIYEVGRKRGAIGYASKQAVNETVRIVPVTSQESIHYRLPTVEHVQKGIYPFVRKVHLYSTANSAQALYPSVKTFLQFILSPQGQEILRKRGFIPLRAKHVQQELVRIQDGGEYSSSE